MLFALIALTVMLLGTGLLAVFGNGVTLVLEKWARDPGRSRPTAGGGLGSRENVSIQ